MSQVPIRRPFGELDLCEAREVRSYELDSFEVPQYEPPAALFTVNEQNKYKASNGFYSWIE